MLTFNVRPPYSLPFIEATDELAESVVSKVTKPKPRGRPVSRSLGMKQSVTLPTNRAKRATASQRGGQNQERCKRDAETIENQDQGLDQEIRRSIISVIRIKKKTWGNQIESASRSWNQYPPSKSHSHCENSSRRERGSVDHGRLPT